MRFLSLLLSVGVLALASGCDSSDDPRPDSKSLTPRQEISLSRGQQEVVKAQDEFAVRLLEASLQGNTVVSPLSASMALSMAANGACGETLDEIRTALGFGDVTLDEINDLNRMLLDRLPSADNATALCLANSLWVDRNFKVLNGFQTTLGEYYTAPAQNISFIEEGQREINAWVSDCTNGRITRLIDSPMDAVAAVVNAVSFNSSWTTPFPAKGTATETFRTTAGKDVKVKMMNSEKSYMASVGADGSAVVRMPFGNEAFMFTAILPPEGVEISDFLKSLDGSKLQDIKEMFNGGNSVIYVKVGLPKFSSTFSLNLIPVLTKLGVNKAFTPAADFSKITADGNIMINMARQSTTIELDEKGVEATSATVVSWGYTSPGPGLTVPVEKVTFDRPFVYMLTEYSTGVVILMGNISEL